MNWLRQLLTKPPEPTKPGPVRFAVTSPAVEWDAEDIIRLRSFFQSPTGRKLVMICGSRALAEGMKEAQGDRATPMAAGMDALLKFQFNLASDTLLISSTALVKADDTANGEQNDPALAEARSF